MGVGPNILLNPNFDSDLSNWDILTVGMGTVTWQSPGEVRLYGNTAPGQEQTIARCTQLHTVDAFSDYRMSFEVVTPATSVYYSKIISATYHLSEFGYFEHTADTAGTFTYEFTTGASTNLYAYIATSAYSASFPRTDTLVVDNMSIQKILPTTFTPQISIFQ